MAQICSSRFGNFSLIFFKTKLPWKQCKRGGSGEDTGFPSSAS